MKNNYTYSQVSRKRLDTAHNDLQRVFELALERSHVDFGIAQGERTVEQQQQYFDEGKSKVNPRAYETLEELLSKGKHIVDGDIRKKSEAVDVYAYYNGKAQWDKEHLCYIAGVVMSCAIELGIDLRWGGNWDSDGVVISDQSFQDLPHFELL